MFSSPRFSYHQTKNLCAPQPSQPLVPLSLKYRSVFACGPQMVSAPRHNKVRWSGLRKPPKRNESRKKERLRYPRRFCRQTLPSRYGRPSIHPHKPVYIYPIPFHHVYEGNPRVKKRNFVNTFKLVGLDIKGNDSSCAPRKGRKSFPRKEKNIQIRELPVAVASSFRSCLTCRRRAAGVGGVLAAT